MSPDVDMRIAAGEALALLYELQRDADSVTIDKDTHRSLCTTLHSLATDGQKSRAKRDLRLQRSSFREIASFIDGSCEEIEPESVKLDSHDRLDLLTWSDRLLYRFFTALIGSGIKRHLQENVFLREEVFGLDPYVPVTPGQRSSSKAEVKLSRKRADHGRTAVKQKRQREKDERRVDVLSDGW